MVDVSKPDVPEYKNELGVSPLTVREDVMVTADGSESVIVPAPFVTVIWLVVPAMVDNTGANPVRPIKSCPFVGEAVEVSNPAVPLYMNALVVKPLTVRELVIVTLLGRDKVTAPVDEETVI